MSLESLAGPSALDDLLGQLGPHAAFSLDLCSGEPLGPRSAWNFATPLEIARRAAQSGVSQATARRNRMMGAWAAEKLGLTGADAEAYARDVLLADAAGLFAKLRKDFDAKGVAQSDHQIRRTMDELMEQAIAQIKAAG